MAGAEGRGVRAARPSRTDGPQGRQQVEHRRRARHPQPPHLLRAGSIRSWSSGPRPPGPLHLPVPQSPRPCGEDAPQSAHPHQLLLPEAGRRPREEEDPSQPPSPVEASSYAPGPSRAPASPPPKAWGSWISKSTGRDTTGGKGESCPLSTGEASSSPEPLEPQIPLCVCGARRCPASQRFNPTGLW